MNRFIYFYIILFLIFAILSFFFVDPNFTYIKNIISVNQQNREILTIIYTILLTTMFFVYVLILKSKLSLKRFKNLFIILFIIGVFSYPAMLSYDIFNYLTTAKVLFFYKENPYIVMPNEFIGEPFLSFTRAANKTALYGPLWIILTGIPFALGLGKVLAVIVGLKVLVGIFFTGITYLIYKITKNIDNAVFFALNPLVLIEVFISGHNDVAMIFFALCSFYLLSKNKYILATVAIMLSIFIKFVTIVLLPLFLYIIYRKFVNKKINYEKIYLASAALMGLVFILSPFREEMYPWYAIWFLPFISLVNNKALKAFTLFLSFGLMLRYIPYMYSGNYFGMTPILREIIFVIPIIVFVILFFLKRKSLYKLF